MAVSKPHERIIEAKGDLRRILLSKKGIGSGKPRFLCDKRLLESQAESLDFIVVFQLTFSSPSIMGELTTIVPSESTEAPEKTLQTACDDSPTRVTNSNTSSETASLPDEQEHQDALLSTLARQLEFYFSPSNLSRDTYLQTLQSLNDGYVPISIVANFAKVQVICSGQDQQVRTQALIKAATSFTGVLEVVHISTVTNKKVAQEDENTILAVGPSTEPSSSSSLLLSPKTPIQNTIILREVPEDVKDEDVRGLFEDNEACPPLQEVRLDVANCWYVHT